jgi:hypothetical protein
MTKAVAPDTWGELGPAMRALPNERWRQFVYNYVAGHPTRGAAQAYRNAGFGMDSTPLNQARAAWMLLHDDRVLAAVAELSRKYYRSAIPEAVQAVRDIIADPDHRDRARVSMALIDRVDPLVGRSELQITTRHISRDEEDLEELKALRTLGATRERLTELFGENYLPRLERLEAKKAAEAKVVGATTIDEIADDDDAQVERVDRLEPLNQPETEDDF